MKWEVSDIMTLAPVPQLISSLGQSDTVAKWVRASAPSSNPGERRNYFYSRVGDGGLSVTYNDGYRTGALFLETNPNH